jgi:hypothetical protein
MGGRMAPTKAMYTASGAVKTDTPCITAQKLTNAYSATELGISRSNATSPTKDAAQDEYATFPTTTHKWPTPTVPPTSGPLDDRKDVNKGVISQETSCT